MQNQEYQNIHSKPTRKVGFVLKTHGFNGHLKISLDDPNFNPHDFLLISLNQKFVPFKIIHFNNDAQIVLLDGINDSESAKFLLNCDILDFNSELTVDSNSIVGYQLLDLNSQKSFIITGLIEMPSQLLIEFRNKYSDGLIPFHNDLIIEIDHLNQIVKANFPDGLLDL